MTEGENKTEKTARHILNHHYTEEFTYVNASKRLKDLKEERKQLKRKGDEKKAKYLEYVENQIAVLQAYLDRTPTRAQELVGVRTVEVRSARGKKAKRK